MLNLVLQQFDGVILYTVIPTLVFYLIYFEIPDSIKNNEDFEWHYQNANFWGQAPRHFLSSGFVRPSVTIRIQLIQEEFLIIVFALFRESSGGLASLS